MMNYVAAQFKWCLIHKCFDILDYLMKQVTPPYI